MKKRTLKKALSLAITLCMLSGTAVNTFAAENAETVGMESQIEAGTQAEQQEVPDSNSEPINSTGETTVTTESLEGNTEDISDNEETDAVNSEVPTETPEQNSPTESSIETEEMEADTFLTEENVITYSEPAEQSLEEGGEEGAEAGLRENSWRYQEGEPTYEEEPSAKGRAANHPNAWQKVNGQFLNNKGEVIQGATKKGIDVSEHNGTIDWDKVKADGIDYAIIRCGYGSNYSSQDDDQWARNVAECERLGIPYGVYLYSYANTLEKAQSEAQHVIRLLAGHNPQYPVYYDLEDEITKAVSNSMKGQMAKIFCDAISSRGYQVGIYANLTWWNTQLTDPVFDNTSWSKWVAQYNSSCSYRSNYDMWQSTSTGKVNGITGNNGNVDINFWMQKNTNTGTGESHVSYRTHVQTYGWQGFVSDGTMSGTEGQAKRLEGIIIRLSGQVSGGIEYSTYVQKDGWQNFVSDGSVSGTEGQTKRLEAIRIRLTGDMSNQYDVYYRVHAQTYGWMGWAKNGEPAGTSGLSKRLEGIQIRLVPKGGAAPGSTENTYVSVQAASVKYQTHVQTYGWQDFVSNGTMAGTEGQAKRLEGIIISLDSAASGGIEYRTHVQTYGWQNFVSGGAMSGTEGQAKRLEAIEIRLTGEISNQYDIYYQVHSQTYGWLGWAKNGEPAGTSGLAKRLEGIKIVLVPKGGAAPGSTANAYYS